MKTINATLYVRPNGRTKEIKILISPDDADYINENNIKVSLEEDGLGYIIIYFDYGRVDEEMEPDELIKITLDENPTATFTEAVEEIKKLKKYVNLY